MKQCNNETIMLFLALLTFLLFFYLAYRRPVLALSALAALLPTYLLRFTISLPFVALAKNGGLPSTMLEFIIWGAFLGWASSLLCPPSSVIPAKAGIQSLLLIRLQKIKYPLALFFIASVISIFIAPDLFSALGKWRAFFLEPLMIFLMILAVVSPTLLPLSKGEERGGGFNKIIFGLSISAFYLSIISIGQKFFHLPNPFLENPARAASVFPQPNMLGLYLGPIIILIIGQLISNFQLLITNKITNPPPATPEHSDGGRGKFQITKIIYWILVIIISFAAIIFAKSDGAIVGVLAGLIIFLVLQNGQRSLTILHNRKVLLGALLLLFIFIFLFFYIFAAQNGVGLEVKNKLLLRDWSGFVRLNIWKESWTMLKDNWLWGAGISGYPIKILPYHASREWMDVYPTPHNIILNFWSELGILGLAAFLWLLEKFFKMCYNLLKSGSSLWKREGGRDLLVITALSAMLVIIVHGLVDVPYFKNDLSILFWIIYSIPLIASSYSTVIPNFPDASSRT